MRHIGNTLLKYFDQVILKDNFDLQRFWIWMGIRTRIRPKHGKENSRPVMYGPVLQGHDAGAGRAVLPQQGQEP